jgi:hypothetical protein
VLQGVNIFSKYVLRYFVQLAVRDVHLLQIEIRSFQVNRTTDVSIYKNYLSLYFVIY